MTIQGAVKDSALSWTNTQDISAQARLSLSSRYAEYHSALDLGLASSGVLKKDSSNVRRRGGAKMK